MFTVKQLAKIAGITPRTLRYYDRIDLLKPAQVGDNGYRYYGEESLLRLQQILLYRALDLPLDRIKMILGNPDFDLVTALEEHYGELNRRLKQTETQIATVRQTIQYLKGETTMEQKQFFAGFSEEQQAEYEKEAMQRYDPQIVRVSNQRWKGLSVVEQKAILDEGNAVYAAFLAAMPAGPASAEAQRCVQRWQEHIRNFWSPDDEQFVGLAEMYTTDERFKANFDQIHPDLAGFIYLAVKAYVENRS